MSRDIILTGIRREYMEDPSYCVELPLAIASVPMQKYEQLFDTEAAFENGTLFRALRLPFEPKEVGCDER